MLSATDAKAAYREIAASIPKPPKPQAFIAPLLGYGAGTGYPLIGGARIAQEYNVPAPSVQDVLLPQGYETEIAALVNVGIDDVQRVTTELLTYVEIRDASLESGSRFVESPLFSNVQLDPTLGIVDPRPLVAERLAQGMVDGRLDIGTVVRYSHAAHLEMLENPQGWSRYGTALYAMAYADAQGQNWTAWEDGNFVPVIYFGKEGPFYDHYGAIIQGSGNCQTFVSASLVAGGAIPNESWGFGDLDQGHLLERIEIAMGSDGVEVKHNRGYFAGDANRYFSGPGNLSSYLYGGNDLASNVQTVQYQLNIDNATGTLVRPLETRQEAVNNLRPGDIIFSKDYRSAGVLDHVSLVVGYGENTAGSGSVVYPTYTDALQNGIIDPVPYAVDHGGANPQYYPRPWTETSTSPTAGKASTVSDVRIDFAYIEATTP
jgi:hypothetical protein